MERVIEHTDYAFFLLYMLTTYTKDKLLPEDENPPFAKAFSLVPNITSYIYCIKQKHLLAVYTKQNRYVLHLDSPIGYAFPLISGYSLPSSARVSNWVKIDLERKDI